MPAEWEPHEGTWLSWPHEKTDWPGKFAPVPWVYCEIVRHLAQVERVHILIRDADAEKRARRMLEQTQVNSGNVDFVRCPTDRSWTRDFCPIFVRDEAKRLVITNWRFNGWAKYTNWTADDAVPSAIARRLRMPEMQPKAGRRRIVLEGGSIDVNGQGLLLTTEECLLSEVQQRNPGLTREDYETIFRDYLGIERTIWLRNGIAGDDTHGHIDDLARFVGPETVVIASESNREDSNYAPLAENYRLLKQTGLKVVRLPMPRPVWFAGQRLPASYANFYIANGLVLVPTFNDPADRDALSTLAKLFPGREVTGVHAVDLVLGLGTLHCMTQQQPA
jgi:agmatine deiminase